MAMKTHCDYFDYEFQGGLYRAQVTLIVRDRKTIGIQLKTSDHIQVLWPKGLGRDQCSRVLDGKRQWLVLKLAMLRERERLTATLVPKAANEIWVLGKKRQVSLPLYLDQGTQMIVMDALFETLGEHYLRARFYEVLKVASEYLVTNIAFAGLKFSRAKSRWGSCSSKGVIMLNRLLYAAPPWVIDYVIWHELAHLMYFNHSKSFWDLVNRHYTRGTEAKQWLKAHQTLLLIQIFRV